MYVLCRSAVVIAAAAAVAVVVVVVVVVAAAALHLLAWQCLYFHFYWCTFHFIAHIADVIHDGIYHAYIDFHPSQTYCRIVNLTGLEVQT